MWNTDLAVGSAREIAEISGYVPFLKWCTDLKD